MPNFDLIKFTDLALAERFGSHKKFYQFIDILRKVLPNLDILRNGEVYLAGGFVRRLFVNQNLDSDLDFFFKNERSFDTFIKLFGENIENKKENDTNVSFERNGIKVQAIKIKYYESYEEIFDSFDFTLCQFGFDGEYFYCSNLGLFDALSKRIVIHRITYPVASLRRLIKYTNQGFYACGGTLKVFLQNIIENPKIVEDKEIEYID